MRVEIEPNDAQLKRLLDTHLTPAKFEIDGVRAIPFADVARHFVSLVGKDVTIGQLAAAANDVTRSDYRPPIRSI